MSFIKLGYNEAWVPININFFNLKEHIGQDNLVVEPHFGRA
jgi:hypothetical protein